MTEVDPYNEASFHVCVIKSDLRATERPKQQIMDAVTRCQFGENEKFAIKLALEEAITNAVKHGNQGDASKQVTIRFAVNEEMAAVVIRDEGEGFEPDEIPDPTNEDRLSVPNGRGIMLLRAYMDKVEFRDQGREIYFMKRRS